MVSLVLADDGGVERKELGVGFGLEPTIFSDDPKRLRAPNLLYGVWRHHREPEIGEIK